jgi:hypothetical protein
VNGIVKCRIVSSVANLGVFRRSNSRLRGVILDLRNENAGFVDIRVCRDAALAQISICDQVHCHHWFTSVMKETEQALIKCFISILLYYWIA